jgi:hypothetical protein
MEFIAAYAVPASLLVDGLLIIFVAWRAGGRFRHLWLFLFRGESEDDG